MLKRSDLIQSACRMAIQHAQLSSLCPLTLPLPSIHLRFCSMSSRIKLNKLWPNRCEGRPNSKLLEGVWVSLPCMVNTKCWPCRRRLNINKYGCVFVQVQNRLNASLWRVSKYVNQGLNPEFQFALLYAIVSIVQKVLYTIVAKVQSCKFSNRNKFFNLQCFIR